MDLVVGRIARAHGIKGEVSVEVRTDAPEIRFAPGSRLRTDPDRGELVVAKARPHSGRLVVAFEGVDDRTRAEALRATNLVVDSATTAPTGDPDEWWDHELVDLPAVLADGTRVGTVTEVLHLPGGDLLAVAREGREELLVPFTAEFVPTVDVAGGRVVIDPPEGLVELADERSDAG
jgi:16S rRNA processing protein RimM